MLPQRAGVVPSPGPRLKISCFDFHRAPWCWKHTNASCTSQGPFQIELSCNVITLIHTDAKMMRPVDTVFLKRLQSCKYCFSLLVAKREKEGALRTEVFSRGAAGETSRWFKELGSSLRSGLCWPKTKKKIKIPKQRNSKNNQNPPVLMILACSKSFVTVPNLVTSVLTQSLY